MAINLHFIMHIPPVPQASKLEPILFLVFIQDVVSNVIDFEFQIFAEDLKLYFPVICQNDFIRLQNNNNAV